MVSISSRVMLPMSSKVVEPGGLRPQRQVHETGCGIVEEADLSLVISVVENRPGLRVLAVDRFAVVAESIDIVGQRQHRDLLGRVGEERAVGLDVEEPHRGVTGADLGLVVDLADFGQGRNVLPLRQAGDVDRLADPGAPDDLDRVEPLVVDVPGLRLRDRDLLRRQAVLDVVLQGDPQILLCLRLDRVEQGDTGADNAQGRSLQKRRRRECRPLRSNSDNGTGAERGRASVGAKRRRGESRRALDQGSPRHRGLLWLHVDGLRGRIRRGVRVQRRSSC